MVLKIVKVVGMVAVLATTGIGAVFYFTSDLVNASNEFFSALKNDDLDGAYGQLSTSFQGSTSRQDLASFVEHTALKKFREADWGSRSVDASGRGAVAGTITTSDGGSLPLTVELIRENETWKIHSLYIPDAGLLSVDSSVELPDEPYLVKLVRNADRIFAEAVYARSMASFRNHVSSLWRAQYSVADLDRAFGEFYQAGVDLTVLENFAPRFTSGPRLDEQGVLVVSGNYPTRPVRYHFEHRYVYEGSGWKLIGYSGNIK